MGDQIGNAVGGTLYYVPYQEFERIRTLQVSREERARLFAALCRINTLYMIACAGSGHIGSSFSSLDIMTWIPLNEAEKTLNNKSETSRDIFFSSKGHDAPALYSVMIGLGQLDFDLLHKLRRLGGLPGHPDISTPNIVTNTGSLGMGVSKAKGMIFANRLLKQPANVTVLTGDGELQEGQFWESLISAANDKLSELTVIIDHNKLQSDTLVDKVSNLGHLEAKLAAFGWHVGRCDGNNFEALSRELDAANKTVDMPKVIIADTVKGKGVSFMEHTSIDSDVELYKFHSGAPSDDGYTAAVQELINTANKLLQDVTAPPLSLETISRPKVDAKVKPQKLVEAYSNALIEQARKNPRIVALDADLILDTGLIPFQKEFPTRFLECGIAEQDMVSQAGGIALQGLLPIVHSFACFLSSRPNEQIYNNATEGKKIIYVGSLAGVVPGGPGHSHQAVRDISALSANPGLVLFEPSCEAEVGMLLDWAINDSSESSYMRLVSLPVDPPYELPKKYRPKMGTGVALTKGDDAAIIAYGPIMLTEAVAAAETLLNDFGIAVKVINLPWLNHVDADWLKKEIGSAKVLFSLDNHYLVGGQGDRISEILAVSNAKNPLFRRIGISEVPECGSNIEILEVHKLNASHICERVLAEFPK